MKVTEEGRVVCGGGVVKRSMEITGRTEVNEPVILAVNLITRM